MSRLYPQNSIFKLPEIGKTTPYCNHLKSQFINLAVIKPGKDEKAKQQATLTVQERKPGKSRQEENGMLSGCKSV
ncbi:hypothetical protein I5M27_09290 [Adhaeribacter sp. BT258]|uniref:Uncharacterized protein n=1 Tax=Adhaeribacter terrigena TaxID=2793070 RepID=A0ABS1C1H1_9BACT|nr:hypothetical protein [Adhaeribacter terrigena]MBK0403178.1 hypothetical protein [Adhaeribacter terrigena]